MFVALRHNFGYKKIFSESGYDMAKKKKALEGEAIVIKKYANRRLYNTDSSSYITLDFLAEMTRKDIDFVVVDAKSGEDITHNILTQIIMEEESNGQTLLPTGFLRQIISLYGDSMQSMVPQFLDASMSNFKKNQKQVKDALEDVVTSGPFGGIAKQNIEFARAARDALMPDSLRGGKSKNKTEKTDRDEITSDNKHSDNEIETLKKQMAQLQAKLDKLDQ